MARFAFLSWLLLQSVAGQTSSRVIDFNQHAWLTYSGDHPISGPWGVHFDTQWRRSDLGTNWQQYQFRPGLNWSSPSRKILLTLGYAFTKSYPYGDFPVRTAIPEHRIYQQILIRQRFEWVRLQHRARMEQRYIQYPDRQPRSWTYQNRFRYMLRAEIPISNRGWYLPLYDEILVGIAPNYGARAFDQNRVFIGLGKSFEGMNVEAGYMNQFLGQRNGRIFEFNNTLLVSITSNLSLSKLWSD